MESNKKIVYLPMAVDILHIGHINIINEAKKLGKVIVGLLSDEAIAEYKRLPLQNLQNRKSIKIWVLFVLLNVQVSIYF